jgi:hypothetical protein
MYNLGQPLTWNATADAPHWNAADERIPYEYGPDDFQDA